MKLKKKLRKLAGMAPKTPLAEDLRNAAARLITLLNLKKVHK